MTAKTRILLGVTGGIAAYKALELIRLATGAGQYDGWLRKFTLAPQIGANRKFFGRPVLRWSHC